MGAARPSPERFAAVQSDPLLPIRSPTTLGVVCKGSADSLLGQATVGDTSTEPAFTFGAVYGPAGVFTVRSPCTARLRCSDQQ